MDPPDDDIQFDFFEDEPPTREAPSSRSVRLPGRGRGNGGRGGGRKRGPAGPRGGGGPGTPLLRLAGLVVGAILVILLFAWLISSCAGSSKHDAYAKYMDHVRVVARNSQGNGSEVASVFTTQGLKAPDIASKLDGIAQQERQNVAAANKLDPPGPVRDEQARLIEALQLRVSGIQGLADAFRATSTGTAGAAVTAEAARLAQQGDRLLASDVVWDDLWLEPARRELKRQGVSQVTPPESHAVANRDLLAERSFANLLNRLKGSAKGGTPTGLHGTNIISLKALPGGQVLSTSTDNTIVATSDLAFTLTVADSGDSQEVGIQTTLTIGEGAGAIKKTKTIALINPGEEKTVTFSNIGQVTFAQKLPIKVDVAAVPGERNKGNNSASYSAIFTLSG
jgi:hypothetical protein